LNNNRRIKRFTYLLLFLTLLSFTPSLASAEIITYDYDNAGQLPDCFHMSKAVKGLIFGDDREVEVFCR